MSVHVNLVVALNSEARPLIEYYGMHLEEQHGGLRIYTGENASLAIGGIGATGSATAVGFLAAHNEHRNRIWVNVGIAGHHQADLGQVYLVDKIVGTDINQTQFPSICFPSPIPSSTLTTVIEPQTDYAPDTLYDMEGAAFFDAAARFSSVELISLIKVVSDNQSHPITKISKSIVEGLISEALPAVTVIIENCRALANELDEISNSGAQSWLSGRHASTTERLKFTRLHHRLACLSKENEIASLLEKTRDTQEAISVLEKHLSSARLNMP